MGRKRLHVVNLKEEEREELKQYLRKGKSPARSLTRARILLLADEGHDDEEIAETLKVSKSTVSRIRTRYCVSGLDSALHEKDRSGAPPKINGRIEVQFILGVLSRQMADQNGRFGSWRISLLRWKL